MEDRRKDDPWKMLVDHRLDILNDKLEKNTLMTSDLLDAWGTIQGGMKALSFLAKAFKWLSGLLVSGAIIWGAVEIFIKRML